MSDSSATRVTCPFCQTLLQVPSPPGGQRLTCPRCQKNWDWHGVPAGDAELGLLDYFEDVLSRMLVGAWRFTTKHLPRTIGRLLRELYPKLLQFARVSLLFVTWGLLVFGPASCAAVDAVFLLEMKHPLSGLRAAWDGILCLCSGVLAVGSYWGLLYVRRRRLQASQRPGGFLAGLDALDTDYTECK